MKRFAAAVLLLAGCSASDKGLTLTEEVEQVVYRTRLRHEGCPDNGFMVSYGQPDRITAYGIDKCIWKHRCDGCGYTNTIYDARWPQFRTEWRVVK